MIGGEDEKARSGVKIWDAHCKNKRVVLTHLGLSQVCLMVISSDCRLHTGFCCNLRRLKNLKSAVTLI